MTKPLRAALYLRVSTDGQTTVNQELELRRVAEARGWRIDQDGVYRDAGISGSKTRAARPGLDKALREAVQRRYDVLMVWSVDRLGRSLPDLLATLQELRAAGVQLFLHQQGIDTSTPAGEAMYGMLGVFAQFERAMIVERVKAGLRRARKAGKHIGRPTALTPAKEAELRELRRQGVGMVRCAAQLGIGVSTVQRLERRA
jgi:DNA invertase Pin-like site-specific DNA recombinase